MQNTSVKYIYSDLLTVPEDTNRYEIFEGELIVTPSPIRIHQVVVKNLTYFFESYLRTNKIGELCVAPFDVYFDEGTVMQPDLMFISDERKHIVEEKRIVGSPDLIVEVLSEGTEERDRGYKFRRYAKENVREYWIVDPEKQTVEIYENAETGYLLSGKYSGNNEIHSVFFPGLKCKAADIFE